MLSTCPPLAIPIPDVPVVRSCTALPSASSCSCRVLLTFSILSVASTSRANRFLNLVVGVCCAMTAHGIVYSHFIITNNNHQLTTNHLFDDVQIGHNIHTYSLVYMYIHTCGSVSNTGVHPLSGSPHVAIRCDYARRTSSVDTVLRFWLSVNIVDTSITSIVGRPLLVRLRPVALGVGGGVLVWVGVGVRGRLFLGVGGIGEMVVSARVFWISAY